MKENKTKRKNNTFKENWKKKYIKRNRLLPETIHALYFVRLTLLIKITAVLFLLS